MKWSEIWSDCKRPSTLIAVVLAVCGIGYGVYSSHKAQKYMEISYRFVNRTKVYDSSSSSPKLRLLAEDLAHPQTPITNDVYVASFQFWNSGTLPIEPVDVRRPMHLELVKGDAFLDWKVAYSLADSDVCKFAISPPYMSSHVAVLNLSWDHFDRGRGCQIQVMFMGDSNATIALDSPFTGNGEIRDVNLVNNQQKQFGNGLLSMYLVISSLVSAGMTIFGLWLINSILSKKTTVDSTQYNAKAKFAAALQILVVTVLTGLILYRLSIQKGISNPFPPDVPISFKANP
jgi:hypothetical protein